MKAMERPFNSSFETFLSSNLHPSKERSGNALLGSASATVQRVHCPTCGSSAERYHLRAEKMTRTQCAQCDYLMILCTSTGQVIESYAPSCLPATLATSNSASTPTV